MSGISEEQRQELQEAFTMFDKDKDGMLTLPEFSELLRNIGQSPTQTELQEMCPGGTIGLQAFLQLMASKNTDTIPEQLILQALRVFDKDGDGYISVAELRWAMTSYGEQISDVEVDAMIQECDVQNGLISCAAFARLMQAN